MNDLNSIWNRKLIDYNHRKKLREITTRSYGDSCCDNNWQFADSKLLRKDEMPIGNRLKKIVIRKKKHNHHNRIYSPGSLNYSYRKERAKRITLENEGIARRLEHVSPCMSMKEYSFDYKQSQIYSKQISRINHAKKLTKITNLRPRLPEIKRKTTSNRVIIKKKKNFSFPGQELLNISKNSF